MEEKNNGKVVEMQPKQEKMSYEQLENIAHQLHEQLRQAHMKLQELNMTNIFKRLDYLFKVVENSKHFKLDFVEKCVAEITELLTIPKEEEEAEPEK